MVKTEERLMAMYAKANPIELEDLLNMVELENAEYLATLEARSSVMTQVDKTKEGETPKRPLGPWLIAAAAALVLGVAIVLVTSNSETAPVATIPTPTTVVDAAPTTISEQTEPTSGPITIEADVNFNTDPASGSFEVTGGADTLGCSIGTFYDTFGSDTEDVTRTMLCSEGDTGAFIIVFDPDGYDTGPGDYNGPWRVVRATADFTGLQGEGDFWTIEDTETHTGEEQFTGDIEYTG